MSQSNRYLKFIVIIFIILVGAFFWMGDRGPNQDMGQQTSGVWPHERSVETVDPNVVWGVLPNGMRYALLPNKFPIDTVSMRLMIDAGSMMEKPEQQGLAHFLEHMAFNGSRSFAPGDLFKELERFGLAKGADSNASTGFWKTIYQLDLPKNDDETIGLGLKIFRDVADGITMSPEEIEKERGVVLSEMRDSHSPGLRVYKGLQQFALGDVRLSHRFPIGQEDVLKTAKRPTFMDFYQNWYQPQNMVLVMVGDITPDALEEKIMASFDGFKAVKPMPAKPDVQPAQIIEPMVGVLSEDKYPENSLMLMRLRGPRQQPPAMADLKQQVIEDLAYAMLNTRYREMILAGDDRFVGAGASTQDYNGYGLAHFLSVRIKEDNWQAALEAVEQELRRAVTYGFRDEEMTRAKADFENGFEVMQRTAISRRSPQLADQLTSTIGQNAVFTHPKDDYALIKQMLPEIALTDIQAFMQDIWQQPARIFYVSRQALDQAGEDALAVEIADYYAASRAVAVNQQTEKEVKAFAYDQLPAAGEIIERRTIDDMGVTQVAFANGAKVSLKATDFEKDTVTIRAGFGNGALGMDKGKPGLDLLAENLVIFGGLGQHDMTELQRLFAGRSVGPGSLGFNIEDDRLWLMGATTVDEAETLAKLLRAWIVDPGLTEKSRQLLNQYLDSWYRQIDTSANGPYMREILPYIHGGDPRFGVPDRADFDKRSVAELRAWLLPQLQGADMEVSVIGDFDMDQMISIIAQTFGTLPKRGEKPVLTAAHTNIAMPAADAPLVYHHGGEPDQALSYVYWPLPDASDVHGARVAALLRSILNNRLDEKLREEIAATYSPGTGLSQSRVIKDYGYMRAIFTTKPEDARLMTETTVSVAEGLTKGGITVDELDRARNPIIESIQKSKETNGYWLGRVLARGWSAPETISHTRTLLDDLKSISLDEIEALAKQHLNASQAQIYKIYPTGYEEK